ncbi:macrolide transporter subunit, membrane fusion protein (MFP) component [Desulfosarcina cetonica]|uniref:macrolide transporter subunit MacA n=1 Tax=Desulfosarcina cetonica TaxID=90730 RepID=UPI0006D28DB9|nr:macrolide transporter subunit MacA [Desulfosarcina cetonica]VTR68399.1 macrolide transporter subunit, membrane fusion protein (MFP) component [Desulfosarcina cetonica]
MQKKGKRSLITILVLLAVVAAGGWLVRTWLAPPEQPVYVTVPAGKRDVQETVSATGVLNAFQQVNVGAQVSGQLQSLKVSLGDSVKKGQLLAVIDPSVKENDLRDAEAALKNIAAQKRAKAALLQQYELAYRRQQTLRRGDAGAEADLESAAASLASTRADIAALDAQITQAKISVDTARTNLGYTQIVAPMDGVVVAVVTDEGQTVVSTQSAPTILILANLDTMTVKTLISEADVIRVKPGMPVFFHVLGDPDRSYTGTLRSVDPAPETITDSDTSAKTISASATYYNGQFDVPNPGHRLRIFMTAQVSIVLGEAKQALCIPLSVLGDNRGNSRYTVRVLKAGHVETREIKTGLKDNIYIQVLDGLKEGDAVVVGDSATAEKNNAVSRPRRFRGPMR